MKAGAENRKKMILAGSLGAVALCCIIFAYTQLFGGDTPSTASVAPVATTSSEAPATTSSAPAPVTSSNSSSTEPANMPAGNAAGVGPQVLASASASLDPTLDEAAMLRTEHLMYSGNGRNIFSATYTPPVKVLPTAIAPARPTQPVFTPPAPPPTCPPSCPPIPLKYFGTIEHPGGDRQAFLLFADDVFLASAGDVVARRYKVVSISPNSIQIEDLENTNTQMLPLQSN